VALIPNPLFLLTLLTMIEKKEKRTFILHHSRPKERDFHLSVNSYSKNALIVYSHIDKRLVIIPSKNNKLKFHMYNVKKPKLLTTILKTVANSNGSVVIKDIPLSKKTPLEKLYKTLLLLKKLDVIEIEGDIKSNRARIVLKRKYDFLNLIHDVKVVFRGDRTKIKSFKYNIIALKEMDKIEVSSYWTADYKYRTEVRVYTTKREKGEMKLHEKQVSQQRAYLKWVLNPPSQVGEIIRYGFKVIQKNYFTFTKEETLKVYKDEEMMDGLQISIPTILARLEIIFPKYYEFEGVKAEKYDIVLYEGPQDPVKIPKEVGDLVVESNQIRLHLYSPPLGMYFVSWKPAK